MQYSTLRDALSHIVASYGKTALLEENRVLALLSDVFLEGKTDRNILRNAFSVGIPAELDAACDKTQSEQDILLARCIAKLVDEFSMIESCAENFLKVYVNALGWKIDSMSQDAHSIYEEAKK